MQEDEFRESKELRINSIIAIATVVLAFVGLVGLILAVAQFIEVRTKILGFGGSVWIVTVIILGLIITILGVRRWIKNGQKK